MKLPWLAADTPFPPPETALSEPDGLLAAGGELTVTRLRQAYSNGIFPWYAEGEPVLWWSPDPRMVLPCADFAPSHSLRKLLRKLARDEHPHASVQVRVDTAFADVILACSQARKTQHGTWITQEVRNAYIAWHAAGQAHSIETWIDGRLAGGLYGVSLGKMFFGESMFARVTDASKIALAYLVGFLRAQGVAWIDCQQQTSHLGSLGAAPIPRAAFLRHVRTVVREAAPDWHPGWLDAAGRLHPLPPPA